MQHTSSPPSHYAHKPLSYISCSKALLKERQYIHKMAWAKHGSQLGKAATDRQEGLKTKFVTSQEVKRQAAAEERVQHENREQYVHEIKMAYLRGAREQFNAIEHNKRQNREEFLQQRQEVMLAAGEAHREAVEAGKRLANERRHGRAIAAAANADHRSQLSRAREGVRREREAAAREARDHKVAFEEYRQQKVLAESTARMSAIDAVKRRKAATAREVAAFNNAVRSGSDESHPGVNILLTGATPSQVDHPSMLTTSSQSYSAPRLIYRADGRAGSQLSSRDALSSSRGPPLIAKAAVDRTPLLRSSAIVSPPKPRPSSPLEPYFRRSNSPPTSPEQYEDEVVEYNLAAVRSAMQRPPDIEDKTYEMERLSIAPHSYESIDDRARKGWHEGYVEVGDLMDAYYHNEGPYARRAGGRAGGVHGTAVRRRAVRV